MSFIDWRNNVEMLENKTILDSNEKIKIDANRIDWNFFCLTVRFFFYLHQIYFRKIETNRHIKPD